MGGPLPPEYPYLAMLVNLDFASYAVVAFALAALCVSGPYLLRRMRARRR
jgi:hypothetical protein